LFNINGENWDVIFVNKYHPKLYRTDGSLSIGACDDFSKTIYINKNLNDYLIKKVLCHEIVHAAMFSYDIFLSVEEEEIVADVIATYG